MKIKNSAQNIGKTNSLIEVQKNLQYSMENIADVSKKTAHKLNVTLIFVAF